MKVFSSWSGGKDSCLACWRAMQSGHRVVGLLNILGEGGRCRSHGVREGVLRAQSEAMGIPIVQVSTSWEDYERTFKDAALGLKRAGAEGAVFGDIDILEHRQWVERVCSETGLTPLLPLWGGMREDLLRELIRLVFESVVVAVRASALGPEWLGRKVDEVFLDELRKQQVDLSGEGGEYHTLVTDGPLFASKIEIMEARRESRGGYHFLDVAEFRLAGKAGGDGNRR